jgi:hypothetical protein
MQTKKNDEGEQKADVAWNEMLKKHGFLALSQQFALSATRSKKKGKPSSIKQVYYSGNAGVCFELRDGRFLSFFQDGMIILGEKKGSGIFFRVLPESDPYFADGPNYLQSKGFSKPLQEPIPQHPHLKEFWDERGDVWRAMEVISYLFDQPYRWVPDDVKKFLDEFKAAGKEDDAQI